MSKNNELVERLIAEAGFDSDTADRLRRAHKRLTQSPASRGESTDTPSVGHGASSENRTPLPRF